MSQETTELDKIIEKQAEGEDFEGKLFRGFEKHQEFTDLQNAFLYGSSDQVKDEDAILNKLTFIVSVALDIWSSSSDWCIVPRVSGTVVPTRSILGAACCSCR